MGHVDYCPDEAGRLIQLSRLVQFTKGLSASWLATLATVLYGLASVPLALQFLTIEEFGLFMLMLQLAGYFTLIELGMAGATARILMDHKDHRVDGSYGSVILTASLVFALQALMIAIVGFIGAPWIVGIVGVPAALGDVAVYLLRWLSATFAIATSFKIFGSLLYANKRLDLLNVITGSTVVIGLLIMAIILASGAGLRGLVVMFLLQISLTVVFQVVACWRLKLLPQRGCWGKPSIAGFFELFKLAKDFFLVSIGTQVLEASHLIIVTRTMGLTAAAIWSVSTKVFALLFQLLTKIQGTGVVFLSEMMIRGESQRLENRFRQICQITAALAAVALPVAVAINQPFVSAWAKPSLAWGIALSSLMAVLIFLNAVTRCYVDLIIHTKDIKALRYIYFLEASAFVGLSLWLAPIIGFYGVLLPAIACLLLARYWYVTWRVAHYFRVQLRLVWWLWLRRSLLTIILLIPFVWTATEICQIVEVVWLQLAIAAMWVGVPATAVLLTVALPPDLTKELRQHFRGLLPLRTKVQSGY